jgi:hypothetical protein
MPTALPHVEAYLAGLPLGLASYPDCSLKVAAVSGLVSLVRDREALAAALTPPIRDLVTAPPPNAAWVPEVHGNVVYLAARDVCCANDEAFVLLLKQMNRALLSSAVYRILFSVVSPRALINNAQGRWESFHRGIALEARAPSANSATVTLRFPSHLLPELMAKALAATYEVVVELAGGKNPHFTLEQYTSTLATFSGRWD